MVTDKRAERVWLRLIQAYGPRVAESYGEDMPRPWLDAVADLTDEQIAYGLRKVTRDTPVHPPTLGQFVAACADMPQKEISKGPTLQEQLCAYITVNLLPRLSYGQFYLPWTYRYREWIDEEKPKHMQKCAECVGVTIDARDGNPALSLSVVEMLADKVGHHKAMRTFQLARPPTPAQIAQYKASNADLTARMKRA